MKTICSHQLLATSYNFGSFNKNRHRLSCSGAMFYILLVLLSFLFMYLYVNVVSVVSCVLCLHKVADTGHPRAAFARCDADITLIIQLKRLLSNVKIKNTRRFCSWYSHDPIKNSIKLLFPFTHGISNVYTL